MADREEQFRELDDVAGAAAPPPDADAFAGAGATAAGGPSAAAAKAETEYLKARDAGTRGGGGGGAAKGEGEGDTVEGGGAAAADEVGVDETLSAEAAGALRAAGNERFKAGDLEGALDVYRGALRSSHLEDAEVAVLHANVAAVWWKRGEWKEVAAAAGRALERDPALRKALLRRKAASERLGDWRVAAEDARKLGCPDAEVLVLEGRAREKEEKEKEKVMGELKGLGNSFLGAFGLSLDNFKVEDNGSGGYSVQMNNK